MSTEYDPTQAIWPDPSEDDEEEMSTNRHCDTQPVTTRVDDGDMNNTETPLVSVPAIYTGPTIMAAFSRPKEPILVHGMAVRLRRIAASGEVTISYDVTDPNVPGMFYAPGTLITGVPLTDLQRYPGSIDLAKGATK